MRVRVAALLAAGVVALVLAGDSVYARKPYHDAFTATYPGLADAAKQAKCDVCHVGPGKALRNNYWQALQNVFGGKKNLKDATEVSAALKQIEATKAPGGMMTFWDQIRAGKLPN
jgi:hypothetical protein